MATIQKQGRGYKITVSQGRDYTGKKIRKYMTWIPEPGMTERQIKKELDRQAVLFEEKVSSGATANGSMRFTDFAEKYMTEYAALPEAQDLCHLYGKPQSNQSGHRSHPAL